MSMTVSNMAKYAMAKQDFDPQSQKTKIYLLKKKNGGV